MFRWIAGALAATLLLGGCADPEQKLRETAAQSAREAASEVNTTRLVVEQLRAHRLWSQPAGRMVGDAEKGVEKAASSFAAQQPSTEESRRLYEQTSKSLDDAETAVTAVRIALGNNDLTAAERQLVVLRQSATDLDRIGELAR
jgi:tRNA(Ser,Leu) C12 N-acetylase TAN1